MEENKDKLDLLASSNITDINGHTAKEPHTVFIAVPDIIKQELFEELTDDPLNITDENFTSDIHNAASGERIEHDLSYGNQDLSKECNTSQTLHVPQTSILKNNSQESIRTVFKCNLCRKVFANVCYLSLHKLYLHTGALKYQCDICKKAFSQINILSVHKLIHSGIEIFECDMCDKLFKKPERLSRHKLFHRCIRFYCDICSKYFTSSGNLQRHKVIHSGAKPFQCDVCNKAFRSRGYLLHHKRTSQWH